MPLYLYTALCLYVHRNGSCDTAPLLSVTYDADLVLGSYLVRGILERSSVKSFLQVGEPTPTVTLAHSMVDVAKDDSTGRQRHLQATEFFRVRCKHSTPTSHTTLPKHIKCKLCMMMRRCQDGTAPQCLAVHWSPVSETASRQHLRSAASHQVTVPPHRRTTMPNFAEISQTVAVIWPFFNYSTFRFFKVAEAAILDFKKMEILRVRKLKTATVRHRAKFRGIGQTVAEIWPFFDFSRWRPPPSWILKMWKF